jgi:hypothetical protein
LLNFLRSIWLLLSSFPGDSCEPIPNTQVRLMRVNDYGRPQSLSTNFHI